MTDEELEEARARAEAATPGPWTCVYDRSLRASFAIVKANTSRTILHLEPDKNTDLDVDTHQVEPDLDFIESARADVPALIEEIDRLRRAAGGGTTDSDDADRLEVSVAALATENARLRAALEFYASPSSYKPPGPPVEGQPVVPWVGNDLGRRAKEALGRD